MALPGGQGGIPGGNNNFPTLTQIQQTLQNVVIAINGLTKVITTVFPQGNVQSGSATAGSATLPGAPAGFITVTLPDGTIGKVPYYNV